MANRSDIIISVNRNTSAADAAHAIVCSSFKCSMLDAISRLVRRGESVNMFSVLDEVGVSDDDMMGRNMFLHLCRVGEVPGSRSPRSRFS